MDDEEDVKRAKVKQLMQLSDCVAQCMEPDAKGHGLFLYVHDETDYMTVLTFNTGPEEVYGLVQGVNTLMANILQTATKDAPPREKYN